MKKYLLIVNLFTFCFENSIGQGGIWTWISGSSTLNSAGVYGIQGIPSVNNYPPAGYEYAEWKDLQGNFWVYGGWVPAYSDMWKYNPNTNEWTWVKGNGLPNQVVVYGLKGVPDPANTPGYRMWASATWVDTTGNLWLFGGGNRRNDLWRYEISSNNWTWINGDTIDNTPGVHGIPGIPSSSNVPGSRDETCSSWTDSLNNLWLFGGYGYSDWGTGGALNDLMRYNIITNEWTWMTGSADTNTLSSYGIMGISSPANVPGGRRTYTKWKDAQGNFWLMGGGFDNFYNDVWRYDLSSNEWTWMAGTNIPDDPGVYQSNCIYNAINLPASRNEQRSSVTDNCGSFWLFGGSSDLGNLKFNDLWIFNPQQLQWNWINGTNTPNQPGDYGLLGIGSVSNIPPSRCGAVAWWGNDNRFYLFGGMQQNTATNFSDLWIFTPDSNCVLNCNAIPVASLNAQNFLCPGTCTSFLNLSSKATTYQWYFPGANPSTSNDINPANICYSTPGSYDVQLIATNSNGSDTLLLSNYITVYPFPSPQSITQSGDTLFAIGGAGLYQWYFNGNTLNGATDYFYVALTSGDYNVVATDMNGCEVEAAIFNVVAGVPYDVRGLKFEVYPNPTGDKLFVRCYSKNLPAIEISIYNTIGVSAIQPETRYLKPGTALDVRVLAPGFYFLRLKAGETVFQYKLVKL